MYNYLSAWNPFKYFFVILISKDDSTWTLNLSDRENITLPLKHVSIYFDVNALDLGYGGINAREFVTNRFLISRGVFGRFLRNKTRLPRF